MLDVDLEEATLLRAGFADYNKDIAGSYVKPLLDENILRVTKDHIKIKGLIIPRGRVVWFHIALTQLRSPDEFYPIRQGINGFTVEKVKAARGNEIVDAYRITSNAEDHMSILLTKKLAWELWEVVAFFIPKLDAPLDEPQPRTPPVPEAGDSNKSLDDLQQDFDYGENEDSDEEEDDEEDGPVTFDYQPFPLEAMRGDSKLYEVVLTANDKRYTISGDSGGLEIWGDNGERFVVASANESEHAEWDEGSEWGEYLTNVMIPALHQFSVETYNDDDETLDEEYPEDVDTDPDEEVE